MTTEPGPLRKDQWAERAARYDRWAASAEAKAEAIDAARPSHASDIAFITQPRYYNAGGRALSRQKARLNAAQDRAMALRRKAVAYRDRAARLRLMASRNAGDAERERQSAREELNVKAGDTVRSLYGARKVVKVNAKTLRIEAVGGGSLVVDRAHCRVVARC